MTEEANPRAVEWHRPWNKALITGLAWLEKDDERGGAIVRRIGRLVSHWAREEGLAEMETRALAVLNADDAELLEPGQSLADSLDAYVAGENPSRPIQATGPVSETAAPGSGRDPEGPVRVLHAEDDPISAALFEHGLMKEGFHVLHFPDGTTALEGALSNTVSCVVLDVKMPGLDGLEVLERLRTTPAYRTVPIMMLTSLGTEEDIVRGFESGADDYMLKPFSPPEVSARLRRLLAE